MPRVTLRDVAERAGVNKACVSVVINGSKGNAYISAAARERILLAAQELGYKRNGGMASVATGRFGCVALLLSADPDFAILPGQVWEGIYDDLEQHDMHLSLFRLPDSELTDKERLPKILREWMADGMLIDYTHNIPAGLHDLITSYALPAVWLNSKQDFDCVRPDDFGAGVAATEHLLRLGHRRIAYVDLHRIPELSQEHYSVVDRYEGYASAMRGAGLVPDACFAEEGPREKHPELLTSLLARGQDRPTAIITYGHEAEAVIWVASRLGLEVPRDISLMSLSPAGCKWSGMTLSSYVVPEYDMGHCASRMIQEKIGAPDRRIPAQVLPFAFVPGNSTAEPKTE